MKIIIDAQTIADVGFDRYLIRSMYTPSDMETPSDTRIMSATDIVGGTLGNEGVIYVGSKQISIDGRTRTITVSDGAINVKGGGGVTVSNGGNITIEDGGDLEMYDDSGNLIIFLGYE